jgi:hypothetical protein
MSALEKTEGRKRLSDVIERYSEALEKDTLSKLSEQDITTKFVLPMLEAFGWDVLKVGKEGPEVHEKAFKDKSDVGKGLPDIRLSSSNGVVFVEVKKPPLKTENISNLFRYEDSDLVVLTSFEDLKFYTRYKKGEPKARSHFNHKSYLEHFDELWNLLSNTRKGKATRAAVKATR